MKCSAFEQTWVKRLSTESVECNLLTSFFPQDKKKARTVCVYYQNDTPQYIHRKIESNGAEYLLVVEEWMLSIYKTKKPFEENFIKVEPSREEIKKVLEEKKLQREKKNAAIDKLTDKWLRQSKKNKREWEETFEPQKIEENKLLTLMDKKMLS